MKNIFIVMLLLSLSLVFSSCNPSKHAIINSGELQLKQIELEKLKEQNDGLNMQIVQLQDGNELLKAQLDSLRCTWTVDLTGDGINETITGSAWPTQAALFEGGGPLKIESACGDLLLDEKSGVLSVVGIYNIGAKTPVLITLQWGGGSMGNYYGAYLFDPIDNKIKRLDWDNYEVAIGILDDSKCDSESIVIKNRGMETGGCAYQPFYQKWIYKDGQMTSVEKWNADVTGVRLE